MRNAIVWCMYVLHSSVSLPMQSVTDAAASQEPPSCEWTFINAGRTCIGCTAQTAHVHSTQGWSDKACTKCTLVSTINCIACQMRQLSNTITHQKQHAQIGKYDAENGMIRATSFGCTTVGRYAMQDTACRSRHEQSITIPYSEV